MIDFSSLFQTYAPDLHRFALYLSGNPALADDLVSETFVRLWNAQKRVDLATVRGYLFAILRNLYLQDLRRSSRATELDDSAHDPAPGPDRQAESRAELDAVLAALQELPEVDRSALLLRAQGNMPYEEIGAALGLAPASVRVRVHRARLKLATARREGRLHSSTRKERTS